jgi:amidase
MTIKLPNVGQVRQAADSLGLSEMSDAEVAQIQDELAGLVDLLRVLDELPEDLAEIRYPRTPGTRPSRRADPLNAWQVKTSIRGAADGPLAGHRVVLKDTVCLAGVPMASGSSTLEGYVPDIDATVVTRILDAGGEIAGKANCEYFCYGAGSHTSAGGVTRNPYHPSRSAGGSSSGTAALVGSGEVSMGIGGDQGGSIRVPAAFCGVYGMKPTHGLVPYTGIFPVDQSLDHVGPMTATVADNALLLEVLAGSDGLDPRQIDVQVATYTAALGLGVTGLRVGVLTEGFAQPKAETGVNDLVRDAVARLADAGATVVEVSIPEHFSALSVWAAIVVEGTTQVAMYGNAAGVGYRGLYPTGLMRAHWGWRNRAHLLSEPMKTGLIAGHYLREVYGGIYYAKAQNLSRALRRRYDEVLADVDLLIMPTVPFVAPALPTGRSRHEMAEPGFEPVVNTAPFDCTGHPALSVPCGLSDGLPVGAMLVGRHWDEMTLYRAADALDRTGDWRLRKSGSE